MRHEAPENQECEKANCCQPRPFISSASKSKRTRACTVEEPRQQRGAARTGGVTLTINCTEKSAYDIACENAVAVEVGGLSMALPKGASNKAELRDMSMSSVPSRGSSFGRRRGM